MKTSAFYYLVLLMFIAIAGCNRKEEFDILESRINFEPSSCHIPSIAASPLHEKHLRFAKLFAVALGRSSALRQAVKDAAVVEGQDYFEEILLHDFLDSMVGEQTVRARLSQVYPDVSGMVSGQTFDSFMEDLLSSDPLLVIKIPDWFHDTTWNAELTSPYVISNRRASDQLLYGFDAEGSCFSKVSYYEFSNIEIVIKTSEDYLWVAGADFLSPYPEFCMSHEEFFDTYARSFSGNYLIRKRDMHKLFLGCGTGPTEPDLNPPLSSCPRDEGFDHNYLIGFRLAEPSVILTLNNQPCLGGEETYDFQVDFLYAFRTDEQSAVDLKLPPVPLYGLRFKQLVDISFEKGPLGITKAIAVRPVYYPIRVANRLFNYFEQISPSQKEWVVNNFGKEIYITWNETDFEVCTSTGVTTVTNTFGATLNFNLAFNWFSKNQNASSTFNTSYTKVSQHTVNVSGSSVVPLGFCGLGYCDPLYSNHNDFPFRPRHWYPTGPQGLLVHCDYVVD